MDVSQSTAEVNVTVRIKRNIVHKNSDHVSLAVIITGLELDARVSSVYINIVSFVCRCNLNNFCVISVS